MKTRPEEAQLFHADRRTDITMPVMSLFAIYRTRLSCCRSHLAFVYRRYVSHPSNFWLRPSAADRHFMKSCHRPTLYGTVLCCRHCRVLCWCLLLFVQVSMTAVNYLFTYLLTYSLTYLLTYLLTHLLTYLLTYSLTYLLTNLLTYLLTHLLTYLLTY